MWRAFLPILAFATAARAEVGLVDGPEELRALLAEAPEKPLIVHVWAAWCAPCEAELRKRVPEFRKAHAKGTRVVLLSLDDSRERDGAVPALLERVGWREKSWILMNAEFDRVAPMLDPKWKGRVPATFRFAPKKHPR